MYVSVRRYGFFFTHKLVEGPMRCILTHGNFLIVYTKERLLKGHAVKLSSAQKINIYCNSTEKVVNLKLFFNFKIKIIILIIK